MCVSQSTTGVITYPHSWQLSGNPWTKEMEAMISTNAQQVVWRCRQLRLESIRGAPPTVRIRASSTNLPLFGQLTFRADYRCVGPQPSTFGGVDGHGLFYCCCVCIDCRSTSGSARRGYNAKWRNRHGVPRADQKPSNHRGAEHALAGLDRGTTH